MHSDKYIQALVESQSFFEIHQEEVLGVSMDVFKNRPKSLVDFLELSAGHGDKPYLIYQEKSLVSLTIFCWLKKQLISCNQNIMLRLEIEWPSMQQTVQSGLSFFGQQ
jgi:hypothetical protein